MDIPLIILAAGKATRFQIGDSSPKAKALAEVGAKKEALIEYILYDWKKAGGRKAIIVAAEENRQLFEDLLGFVYHGMKISYVVQKIHKNELKPRGTVDAMLCGAAVCPGPVMLCNGDDIYGEEAYRIILDNLSSDKDIITLGYAMENCVPKHQGEGVSRAVLKCNKRQELVSCTELSRLIWEGDKIIDLGTGNYIGNSESAGMNILYVSETAMAQIKKINDTIPYADEIKMIDKYKKREYLIPELLDEISKKMKCIVIPFGKSIPYGVTRQSDLPSVIKKTKALYPSPLWRD